MQPTHTAPAENGVPIKITRLELAGGGVAAVGNANGTTDAEPAFGEVESIADGAAYTIVWHPFDELGIHTPLQNKIFDETAYIILSEGRADRCLQSKTTAQSARDIVFAAAFPGFEFARSAYSAFTRIQAEHDFTEGKQVVLAGTKRFNVQSGHCGLAGIHCVDVRTI